MRSRPLSGEYPEYYETYISLVPNTDIVENLQEQGSETVRLLQGVAEERSMHAYETGKWTLKEVVGHMADTERVMSYRMLAVARGEPNPLQGMDQNLYAASANFNQFSWRQLIDDLQIVRRATLSLISTIDETSWARTGMVWNASVAARAFAYIIAGHEAHHVSVIREKYLG